jgi:DHA1 family tetracycline resistance protein-like MFS transporter
MLALFFVVFVDLIGFGMVIPLLPLLGEATGATPFDVGLLMASFSACQFVAAPLWGALSDRIGRKPVLLAGLAGSALCYWLMAHSTTFPELLATRSLAGLMAGNISAAFAYAADTSTTENRTKAMGIIGAAFGLGFIGGPVLGGVLAGSGNAVADFVPPALTAAGLSAAALVLAALTLKEKARPAGSHEGRRTGLKAALHQPALAFPLLAIFISTCAFAGMETSFPMWSKVALGWGPRQNGFMFAFMGFVSAMVQGGATHRLAKRLGEWKTAAIGTIVLAAGMVSAAFAGSLALLVVPAAAMALGFGLVSPSLNSALSLVAKSSGMGAAMGAGRSVSTGARALGPIAAGSLFGIAGKAAPFLAGGLLLAGLGATLILRLRRDRIAEGAS